MMLAYMHQNFYKVNNNLRNFVLLILKYYIANKIDDQFKEYILKTIVLN